MTLHMRPVNTLRVLLHLRTTVNNMDKQHVVYLSNLPHSISKETIDDVFLEEANLVVVSSVSFFGLLLNSQIGCLCMSGVSNTTSAVRSSSHAMSSHARICRARLNCSRRAVVWDARVHVAWQSSTWPQLRTYKRHSRYNPSCVFPA